MNLSIIIVNYNVKEFLQNLLHSIEKASSGISKEIIIVDNASDDGSVELIREKFPDVKLIVNKKNLGFGKANNQALKIAKGDFMLMLNPDTLVSEDTFDKMIGFFNSNPEAGLAGCKILNPDGSLQLACRRSFPGPWTSFTKVTGLSRLFPKNKLFARYNLTYLDENKSYEVDAISGSFMMMRREVYEKVGGFDEQFFMYGEDLDLCYRIQKAGYKVFYVHSTQIIHYKGESTKRSSLDETRVFYNAMHLFVKKHLSSSFLVEVILRTAIGVRKIFAFFGKRKLAILSAIIDFLLFDLCLFVAEQIYISYSSWVGFNLRDYPIIYTIPALIHIITASLTRVYKRDTLSVLSNFLAIIISFVILTSITFFFKQFAYSRAVVLITYLLLSFSTTLWRFLIKLIFKVGLTIDNISRNRTLIIGTEQFAIQIANKIRQKRTEYHTVIGLVGKYHNDIGKNINSFEVVGSIENIKKVIDEYGITEVIFSSKDLEYSEMMAVVSDCRNEPVEFKISGSELEFIVGKTSVSMLDDIPLVEVQYNISSPLMRFIKRTFDIIAGMLVLLFIYPFIYFISKMNKKKTDFRSFILNVPLVVRGKKSFVGPKLDRSGKRIFMGRQGLTGFWYIDNDSNIDFEKLDFYYAKNQNIWLDLEILGRTLNKMWNKRD
ncbi:N-acetylglucosaminyl-diphospho-decaprenol L-rhamnosyltransferase [bacterium BMS3Abin03]|nr:N-acetylglucosaminyl-diphospho-decaprenol L-rhamnosyltransferase [bacterium BMS3Abin03]